MSFERKKQLNMIDRNLDFTKSLSSKMQDQVPNNARSSVNIDQGYPGNPNDIQGYAGGEPSGPMGEGGLPPRGMTSQSVEGGIATRRAPNPRNDYEHIKLKNSAWGNKFDIISNKIKDFAK